MRVSSCQQGVFVVRKVSYAFVYLERRWCAARCAPQSSFIVVAPGTGLLQPLATYSLVLVPYVPSRGPRPRHDIDAGFQRLEPDGRVNGVPKRKQRFRAGPFL